MGWTDTEFSGAMAVFVWLVDGRPLKVMPVPAAGEGRAGAIVVSAVFRLRDDERRGFPAVLLLNSRGFIAPRPWFGDPTTDALVAEMFLGGPEALVSAMAKVKDVNVRALAGLTLLHLAAENGLTAAAEALLARKTKVNAKVTGDSTPLHWAAENGRREAAARLLSAKADCDAKDTDGNTPIFLALLHGHEDVARDLLAARSDLRLTNRMSQSPITLAIDQGCASVLGEMLQRGARFDFADVQTARILITQAARGHLAMVRLLVEKKVDTNAEAHGATALLAAAHAGNREMIETLLKAGAKPGYANPNGITPLMIAAQAGNREAVEALLTAGAEVKATDKRGRTALHLAVFARQAELIAMLVAKGVQVEAKDAQGRTPLALALQARSRASAIALVTAGARLDLRAPDFAAMLEQAIALDLKDLVAKAVAEGWNPATPFYGQWPAWQVADLYGAKGTADQLKQQAPTKALTVAGADAINTKPKATKLVLPEDPRDPATNYPEVTFLLSGVVDSEGLLRFPRIEDGADPQLVAGTMQMVEQWRFTPAMQNGRPVATRIGLPLVFAAASERARESNEVASLPQPRKQVKPDFPFNLRKAGRMGQVTLGFVVERDGRTSEIQVVSSSHPDFEAAAIAALAKWEFSPGMVDGRPVRTKMVVPIVFTITN